MPSSPRPHARQPLGLARKGYDKERNESTETKGKPDPDQSTPIHTEISFPARAWLFPSQLRWLQDQSILRLREKSRQLGATKTDALDSVLKASPVTLRGIPWS